jgi:Flp pilus assembly pilin Flp
MAVVRALRDEEGSVAAEYGLLLALVVLTFAASIEPVGRWIVRLISSGSGLFG